MSVSKDCVVNCMLFLAQRQDCKSFEEVCKTWPWGKIKQVVADKGYDTGPVRRLIRDHGAQPVIPPKRICALPGSDLKPSDCYDVKTYRERHFIERLFGRIKENKRIAMRFDKRDTMFLSFIALALLKAYKLFC